MSKHTPGPWEARIKDACFVHRPADPHFPIYVPGDDATRAADAHLIAAAPDMLEALRAAREHVDYLATIDGPVDDDGIPLDDAAAALLEIDAAIDKAEARTGSV